MGVILHEKFSQAQMDPRLHWLNEPRLWDVRGTPPALTIRPEGNTDFWQKTHYGFSADNGHFLWLPTLGNITVQTRVAFHPVHQYDQAGLMIRSDADCWVKASVEHELTGLPQLGTVVTSQGFSDWSLQDLPFAAREIELRLCKRDRDVTAEFRAVGEKVWRLMRMARWQAPSSPTVLAGLYACSPKGEGYQAEFSYLEISDGQ